MNMPQRYFFCCFTCFGPQWYKFSLWLVKSRSYLGASPVSILSNCSMFALLERIFISLFLSETCMSALVFLSTWVYQFSPICQSALIWNRDYVCVSLKGVYLVFLTLPTPFKVYCDVVACKWFNSTNFQRPLIFWYAILCSIPSKVIGMTGSETVDSGSYNY